MITYKHYDAFYDIPDKDRNLILRKLGISSGIMRDEAKNYNSPCLVAYDEETPIGWTALHPRHPNNFDINVFVSTKYRSQGIASHLINEMIKNVGKGKIYAMPYNDKTKRFFHQFKRIIIERY